YSIPLERDPGQVFVDGKPIYMKLDKVADFEWKLGTLTDAEAGLWQFDAKGKRLLLNLGEGNPAEDHVVEVPTRPHAFVLGANWRIGGLRVHRYASTAIVVGGDDTTVQDCLVTDCAAGIVASGWDRRGVVIRRNTVIGALGNGIFLQDRPTHTRIEDNLVIRCTLNPWHQGWWMGSVKMNSASDSLFAHNVVLEAGNPETINGWDGWALWGDINIVRVMYLGNACAHNKEAGIYVEFGMGDTQVYFNTSHRDGHGITCRQSQRGLYLRNYIQSPRSSGLAVWAARSRTPLSTMSSRTISFAMPSPPCACRSSTRTSPTTTPTSRARGRSSPTARRGVSSPPSRNCRRKRATSCTAKCSTRSPRMWALVL
ncbi:MAG: right-handed parallel beta-helix repeat-containing protein, partial [Armatimonadetes bacterium]|nr:right-handed parallel beta-helix repeat-containing protein [Armatimonadota bacterium]